MKPNISVVIPTYNRAQFLKESVDSVLCQTYNDFELIIIDDGSKDKTKEVIASYQKTNIRYIFKEHRGVSSARNLGISEARGEYIAFLDSDDLWMPKKLALQKNFMETNPKYSLCYTEEIWIRKGIRVNACKKHKKYSGDIFDKCLPLCIISPSSAMIRSDILRSLGGFDEELPACEDYDLWLRLTLKYPVYLIEKQLILKRGGHANQLSNTIMCLDKYRIKSLERLLSKNSPSDRRWKMAWDTLYRKCQIYGNGCIKHGKIEEGEYYFALPDKLLARKDEKINSLLTYSLRSRRDDRCNKKY